MRPNGDDYRPSDIDADDLVDLLVVEINEGNRTLADCGGVDRTSIDPKCSIMADTASSTAPASAISAVSAITAPPPIS